MNIALNTVIILTVLLPGIGFRIFLIKSEGFENPLDTSLKAEIGFVLFFSLLIHSFFYSIIYYSHIIEFDIVQFIYILYSETDKLSKELITNSIFPTILYLLVSTLFSIGLAILIKHYSLKFFLDFKFNFVPISNEWDKLLSGREYLYEEKKELKEDKTKIESLLKEIKTKSKKLNKGIINLNEIKQKTEKLNNKIQNYSERKGNILAKQKKIRNEIENYQENSLNYKLFNRIVILLKIQFLKIYNNRLEKKNKSITHSLTYLNEHYKISQNIIPEIDSTLVKSTEIKSETRAQREKLKEKLKEINEELKNPKKIDVVYLDILTDTSKGLIIYRGELHKYFLSKNNSLDKIILFNVNRKPFNLNAITSNNSGNNDSESENDNSENGKNEDDFYEFDSKYFVIKNDEIKNLNTRFIRLELEEDQEE